MTPGPATRTPAHARTRAAQDVRHAHRTHARARAVQEQLGGEETATVRRGGEEAAAAPRAAGPSRRASSCWHRGCGRNAPQSLMQPSVQPFILYAKVKRKAEEMICAFFPGRERRWIYLASMLAARRSRGLLFGATKSPPPFDPVGLDWAAAGARGARGGLRNERGGQHMADEGSQ